MARRRKPLPVEPVQAQVSDMGHDGRGVARVNDKVVFIDGALAGEEVSFIYTRQRGRFDEGRVQQVLRASSQRAEPACPHFSVCGGCSLQHMASDAQLEFKQRHLLHSLQQIGKVQAQQLLAPLRSDIWAYRRKARLGVRYVRKKEKLLVGFREKRSNYVADLSVCKVLVPQVGERLDALRRLIGGLQGMEHIPQVEVAVGDDTSVLVVRHLQELGAADLAALDGFGQQHDLAIYLQSGGPDTVRPLNESHRRTLSYRLPDADVEIQFEPGDFTQVNAGINRQMVNQVLALLEPGPEQRILDLFCGLGNFTLPVARQAGWVTGVEGDPALVQRAADNARRNNLDNVEFHAADLMQPDPQSSWWQGPYDKILLDPPRSGAQEVIALLKPPYPQRIVYVSCDPATLSRDAGLLVTEHGYQLASAGVMDMFPHTGHVESVAVFER